MHTTAHPLAPEFERLARRRAKAQIGFGIHALVYLVVITGLGWLAVSQGEAWALWPAAGWGFGLLMHGLGAWGFGLRGAWQQRLVERLVKRLVNRLVERERKALRLN